MSHNVTTLITIVVSIINYFTYSHCNRAASLKFPTGNFCIPTGNCSSSDIAGKSGLLKKGPIFQFHDNFFFPVGFTF